jgi:TP901 family phage tail tape measure protein
MADENVVTNIVATADFSDLIGNVNKLNTQLAQLKQNLTNTDKALALQAAKLQQSFSATLRSTGQFSTHFVSLSSDVEKFGKNLDSGKLKLRDYYNTWQNHQRTSGGLIRDLAKQQVQLQNAILQPLGRNAEGLMQFNVQIPRGLDAAKNRASLLKQEMQIMNKVIQDGGVQLINWGKNTQWAGRQLTVGLTLPLAAFGKAAADAFRAADEQLVRLTKVYGGVAQTSAVELGKIRKEVAATAKELAQSYGASYTETISLAADIAATGKQGEELLNSTRETTRLSVLGEVDRQEAMKATLAIQTAFNQNTQQLSESINFLNAVENQTSTSLADLIEAIPKAGPVVKSLGGDIQDLALYLTAMKEGGINASEGANAIKSSLASLINPTKVAKEMFAGFGIDLGGIVTNNAGDLTGTILALQKALDSLDPLTKAKAIEQLFGKFQFARLSALFDNLGKQGSQTLEVLDLMNASASDLANVAGRELSQITESASGKYRRAIEGLKADLAGIGDSFLNIQTFFINLIDKVIEFSKKLPDPLKKILTFVGGLTAVAGPLIMLTGVLANFFGYIVKGAAHFRALFKGGEGWKLLTPEILAAQKAGNLMETTFYSDAKAANILQQAISNLNIELDELSRKANAGAISAQPMMSTIAGNAFMGGGREVVPNHPLISDKDTRSFSHLNPVSRMTAEEKSAQTIFGVVPGAPLVNQKISNNPQMYMSGDVPKVAGASAIRGVSTGIVSEEAAKWHAMTGALAMQSKQEIALLKREVAATGLITTSLSDSYQALLPEMSRITTLAATESAQIVAELQASKINVDQARAKIIALNRQIETMMGQAATGIATAQGRTINLTQLPIVDQPAFDPVTGKANMKELTRPRNRGLISKIAQSLGVKTFGAPYSIETTRPKRFATGNLVPGNGNSDTVPALLTPGEFVINKKATSENLPLLEAINGGRGSRSGNFRNGGGYLEDNIQPLGPKTSGLTSQEVGSAFPGFSGKNNFYTVKGTAGLYIGDVTDPVLVEKYKNFLPQGKTYFTAKSLNGKMANGKIPSELLAAAIESSGSSNRGSTEQFLSSLHREGIISEAEFKNTSNRIYDEYIKNLKKPNLIGDSNNNYWQHADRVLQQELGNNEEVKHLWNQFSSNLGVHTGDRTATAGRSGASSSHRSQTLTTTDGKKIKVGKLRGSRGTLFAHARSPKPFLDKLIKAGLTVGKIRMKNKGGYIGMNAGGMVPGYEDGGRVMLADQMGLTPSAPGMPVSKGAGSSYMSGLRNPYGKSIIPKMSGKPMGMGAQMGIGMAGMMAGQAVGGNAGTAIMMASNILPMMTAMKGFGKLIPSVAKVASILGRLTIPGAIIGTLVGIATLINKMKKDAATDALGFGLTAESASKAGLKFTDYNQKIKDSIESAKAMKERNQMLYESMTQSNTPLKMSIEQYKKLKEQIKETMPEYIKLIDRTKSDKVGDVAVQLKAQFIAAGDSAEEATAKIYALIEASNKKGSGFSAITSEQFRGIKTPQDAALTTADTFAKSMGTTNEIAQASSLLTAFEAINTAVADSAKKNEEAVKNNKAELISIGTIIEDQISKINKGSAGQITLSTAAIEELRKQNPELAKILNGTETLTEAWSKYQLLLKGVSLDLSTISGKSAEAALQVANTIESSISASLKNPKNGLLKFQYEKLDGLTTRIKNLTAAARGQSVKDQQSDKAKIKSLNAQINLINKLADDKIKALRKTQSAENSELEIQQAKLEYQQAIARGDRDSAAQAQMRIQQLVSERQTAAAEENILSNAATATAPLQAEIDKINDKQEKMGNAAALAGESLGALQTEANNLSNSLSGITSLLTSYFTDKITNPNYKGTPEELAALTATSGGLSGLGVKGTTGPRIPFKEGFETKGTLDFISSLNKSIQLSLSKEGITLGSNSTVIINGEKLDMTPVSKNNISSVKYSDLPSGTSQKVGTLFTKDGIKYKITGGADRSGFIPVQKNADGGYISGPGSGTSDSIPAMLSNGEFVVSAKAVQAAGLPMLDRINKMGKGGPVYDVPSYSTGGRVKYDQGGVATSSNSLYNINVTLNGSNLNPNDVAKAIDNQMRLREAMNGRGRNI